MRLRATDYERMHGLMASRGFPSALTRREGVVERRDLTPCNHAEARPVAIERQVSWLRSSMMAPVGDWLLVVGTRRDPDLVDVVGIEFFARAWRAHLHDPSQYPRPLWHRVTGGWTDRLRDDHRYREEAIGTVGVLVLSGLTADCTSDKLEKTRDLLHLHAGIPRLVLLAGGDPLAFGYDRLHCRPDRVVFVNRSRARADRDYA